MANFGGMSLVTAEILTLERLLLQALVIRISVEKLMELLVFFDVLREFYLGT